MIALDCPERYPPPPVPTTKTRCVGDLSTGESRSGNYRYEFDPVEIRPIPTGPRIREQPRVGYQRVWSPETAPTDKLNACYRSLRALSPRWEGTVTVDYRVDEFGLTERVGQVTSLPEFEPMNACVIDVLRSARLQSITPRKVDVTLTIHFHRRSAMGTPLRVQKRPAFEPPSIGPACLPILESPPVDRLSVEMEVDDLDPNLGFDEHQAIYNSAVRAWKRGGQRGEPPPPLVFRKNQIALIERISAREINTAFNHNLGAFKRCYAEAFMKRPGLAGRVEVEFWIDDAGSVLEASVRQDESTDLHNKVCFLQAARELWVETSYERPPNLVKVLYPIILVPTPADAPLPPEPPTVSAVDAYAKSLQDGGWPEAALRAYGALLDQGEDHPRRCHWHVGALRAAFQVAPWIDERVVRASHHLIEYLSAPRASPEGQDCLADAVEVLERYYLEAYERSIPDLGYPRNPHLPYFRRLSAKRYRGLVEQGPFLKKLLRVPGDIDELPQ